MLRLSIELESEEDILGGLIAALAALQEDKGAGSREWLAGLVVVTHRHPPSERG